MKKIFIFVVFLLAPFVAVQAQGILIGADLGAGIPQGDFADAVDLGIGGELKGRVYLKDKFMVGANVGYYYYSLVDRDNLKVSGETVYIPLTAGAEYFFFTKLVKPYVGLDAGLYFNSFNQEIDVDNLNTSLKNDDTNSSFGIAPNAGVMLGLGGVNLNANVKYVNIFGEDLKGDNQTNTMFVFQLGLAFKFGV